MGVWCKRKGESTRVRRTKLATIPDVITFGDKTGGSRKNRFREILRKRDIVLQPPASHVRSLTQHPIHQHCSSIMHCYTHCRIAVPSHKLPLRSCLPIDFHHALDISSVCHFFGRTAVQLVLGLLGAGGIRISPVQLVRTSGWRSRL